MGHHGVMAMNVRESAFGCDACGVEACLPGAAHHLQDAQLVRAVARCPALRAFVGLGQRRRGQLRRAKAFARNVERTQAIDQLRHRLAQSVALVACGFSRDLQYPHFPPLSHPAKWA